MTELLHPPPQMTPKRKRTDPPPLSPARSRIASSPSADSAFTFQLPTRSIQRPSPFPDLRETGEPADSPDAAESPASSGVVRQFRGLAVLDNGSGRAGGGQNDDGQDDDGDDSEGGGSGDGVGGTRWRRRLNDTTRASATVGMCGGGVIGGNQQQHQRVYQPPRSQGPTLPWLQQQQQQQQQQQSQQQLRLGLDGNRQVAESRTIGSGANCKINDESKGVAPLLEQGDEGLVARKRLKRDEDGGDGGSDSPASTTMMNIDQVTSQQHPYLAPRAATAVWPMPTTLPNAEPSLPSSASTLLSEPAQVTEVHPGSSTNARKSPDAPSPKSKKASRKQRKKLKPDPSPIQDLQGSEDAAATSTPAMIPQGEDDEDSEIVEPIRAALTWREEEITVYDPEDKDDDGAGMDGVGFQPPPAIARAIALKKRQQLLAYKKMVDGDARAKRNERRRGREAAAAAKESARRRRVRFLSPDDGLALSTSGLE